MNKKGLIISGGTINTSFALQTLKEVQPDYIIGVDKGLEFLYQNQIVPSYIVGDFDSANPEIVSYYKEHTTVPIRKFNPVKDASDTEISPPYRAKGKIRIKGNVPGRDKSRPCAQEAKLQ